MIKCLIRYYFKSKSRIVRFERVAKFPAVPFIGSQLSLKVDDHLTVEDVIFCEEELPILIVPTEHIDSLKIDDTIDEMKESGWVVASDKTKNK